MKLFGFFWRYHQKARSFFILGLPDALESLKNIQMSWRSREKFTEDKTQFDKSAYQMNKMCTA